MPDNDNNEAFNRLTQARAATEIPAPSTDNHATIDDSNSVWNCITTAPFIKNLSGGQEQRLVLSADHIVQVQHNQIVKIQQAQNTTAQLEITITSAENQIHLVEHAPAVAPLLVGAVAGAVIGVATVLTGGAASLAQAAVAVDDCAVASLGGGL